MISNKRGGTKPPIRRVVQLGLRLKTVSPTNRIVKGSGKRDTQIFKCLVTSTAEAVWWDREFKTCSKHLFMSAFLCAWLSCAWTNHSRGDVPNILNILFQIKFEWEQASDFIRGD